MGVVLVVSHSPRKLRTTFQKNENVPNRPTKIANLLILYIKYIALLCYSFLQILYVSSYTDSQRGDMNPDANSTGTKIFVQ